MNQAKEERSSETSFPRLGSKFLNVLRQLLRTFPGYRVIVASPDATNASVAFEAGETNCDRAFQECFLRIIDARFQLVLG
jgi:hypothetical protein